MKWRLKTKMWVSILSISLVVYVLALGYISIVFKDRAVRDAQLIADNLNKEGANLVRAHLNEHFGISRALAQAFMMYKSIPSAERNRIFSLMTHNVLAENPEYTAVFEQWELNAIDPDYSRPYGRVRKTHYRSGEEILFKTDTLDTRGDDTTGIYYQVKSGKQEVITRPYYYSYNINQALPEDEPIHEGAILMATVITPIIVDGRYVGMTGMDFPLERFQEIIEEIKPLEQAFSFLVANDGQIVAHPNKEWIKQQICEIYPEVDKVYHFNERIASGEKFSFMSKDSKFGKNAYVSFVPVTIARTNTPWSMGIVVPVDIITREANHTFYFSILAGLVGLIILALVIWVIAHNITRPLKSTTNLLKNLASGSLHNSRKIEVKSKDELEEMAESANTLLEGLSSTAGFAKEIGEGNLTADYKLLSDDDALGQALVEMRDRLKRSTDEIKKQADHLKELNAAKDKFFSIIAHDLKNPFSVLLSVTEALLEGFDQMSDREKSVAIQRIHKSANLLFNLLDNLLQWSMAQTGRLTFHPEKADLRTIVFGTMSLLRMNAENKHINMSTTIPEQAYVHADVDMVKTVIRNLLSNAIKFNSEEGRIKITAKKKGGYYEIDVSDTGVGISKEDQEKLFRIDVKNKSIGSSKDKGTGLGLILSKEYIEKNGGRIWVESEPGKGSHFLFTLPAYNEKKVPERVE